MIPLAQLRARLGQPGAVGGIMVACISASMTVLCIQEGAWGQRVRDQHRQPRGALPHAHEGSKTTNCQSLRSREAVDESSYIRQEIKKRVPVVPVVYHTSIYLFVPTVLRGMEPISHPGPRHHWPAPPVYPALHVLAKVKSVLILAVSLDSWRSCP